MNISDDWMLQVALKYEKDLLDLETKFDGEMKNTENVQKLKRTAMEKERMLLILPGTFTWLIPLPKPRN